jgi:hypothetical protein
MSHAQAATSPNQRSVLAFLAIGAVLYLTLLGAAEYMVYRNGHDNPIYKIATADRLHYDWLVLGTSHAMPLGFEKSQSLIEEATGSSILNLSLQGVGPLYNLVILEQFLESRTASGLIYAVDSFAFRSPQWNEERLADADLLSRTPLKSTFAQSLLRATLADGVDPVGLMAYISGFPKLRYSKWFEKDQWSGEDLFERRYRASALATDERIKYLYPLSQSGPDLVHYLQVFSTLLDRAHTSGMKVIVLKLPVPPDFYAKLPGEADFNRALEETLRPKGLSLHDFSKALPDARYYFDSDHLGLRGIEAFMPTLISVMKTDDGEGGRLR